MKKILARTTGRLRGFLPRWRDAAWSLALAVAATVAAAFLFSPTPGRAAAFLALTWVVSVAVFAAARRAGGAESGARSDEDKIDKVLGKLIEGDLSDDLFYGPKRIRIEGVLYFSMRKLVIELRHVVGKFNRLSSELSSASNNLLEMTDSLSYSAREQGESVEEVHKSLEDINASIRGIQGNVHDLVDIVGDTSSAILEMTANIEEVTDSTKNIAGNIEETASAMEEMAQNVRQVSEAGRELYARASDNAASMAEMDTAIEEVGESAKITAEIAEAVKRSADEGREAVLKTSESLQGIEASVAQAVSVIAQLGKQSGEIGKIVKVIKDIADQTNLLALNAAIIAAQAGKEGRSFAVVAEEIRELSERTATSVAEIGGMVKGTQNAVQKAVTLMETTSERVQSGVTLGAKAEISLQVILERTHLAVENVAQIAKATAEQTLGSRRITESTDEMAAMIEKITTASEELSTTSRAIKDRTSRMADATTHTFRAMEEQMAGSRAISEGMERVNAIVNGIEDSLATLSRGSETVLRAMDIIRDTTHQNTSSSRNLYSTVSAFRQEAILFRDAIAKFRLPAPKRGGTLRSAVSRNLDIVLDPGLAQTVVAADIVYNLFDGLTRFGEGTDLHPALARRWNISADGLKYTFFLRDNGKFHDGRPVRAHDVKASFERILRPDREYVSSWILMPVAGAKEFHSGAANEITGIRVLNDHTLEITLVEPVGFFLSYLTLPELSVIPEADCGKFGKEFNEKCVGTGPFMLHGVEADGRLVLRRNPNYFLEGQPYVDELVFRSGITDDEGVVALLKRGEVDYVTSIPAEHLHDIMEDPVWAANVHSNIQLNTSFMGIRNDIAPFNDRRVRQALNYAVNREFLNGSIHHGLHVPAKGILPPGVLGYNANRTGFPYDPEKARALLAEAGFPSGFKTRYAKSKAVRLSEDVTYVLSCLAEVGVEVEIEEMDEAAFRQTQKGKNRPPLWFSGWYADYPDPDSFFYSVFHSKSQDTLGLHYANPRVDILMEEARRESDLNVRERLYRKAEDILVEDAPMIFLLHLRAYVATQSNVGGIRLNLTPPALRPEDLWIER